MSVAELAAGSRRRLEVRRADRDQREIERTADEQWARDPLGWIDRHVTIASKFTEHGGRTRVRPVKMTLYPKQRETISEWIDLDHLGRTGEVVFRNVLIEKSRQIGETWGIAAAVRWLLGYHQVRGLFMSLRAAEVADRGWTVDSFMGRVRYIDKRLDRDSLPQLKPLDYRGFSSDPAAIENPANGAILRGECQRDDPGRGSTFDFVILDEAAHLQHGELVHAAVDDACPDGKLYLSTPQGDDNMHARLCDERPAGWAYMRIHWSTHPVYGAEAHVAGSLDECELCQANRAEIPWSPRDPRAHRYPGKLTSPWYDQAVIGKTDEQVAGELDIDRAGALGARVYSEFEDALHAVADGIPYDPAVPFELAFDFGLDCTSVPVVQNTIDSVNVIGLLECGDLHGNDGTPDGVMAELLPYLESLGITDVSPTVLHALRCVGDPAGQGRSMTTSRPYVEAYAKHGLRIIAPPSRMTARVDFSITSVKLLLNGTPKPLRVCGVNARAFAQHMRNNTWPMDATGQRRVGATQPLDNAHNHCCRAFAYWAVDTFPPVSRVMPARTFSPARMRVAAPSAVPRR